MNRQTKKLLWLVLLVCNQLAAQELWLKTEISKVNQTKWVGMPFQAVEMDRQSFEETINSGLTPLPLPSGEMANFEFRNASIMSSSLQAKYPHIQTFKAENEHGETARVTLSPKGLSAILFTQKGTVYIDPLPNEPGKLISYYWADYRNHFAKPAFDEPFKQAPMHTPVRTFGRSKKSAARPHGADLRKYRIAIAADHTYTEFHGGTISDALAGIVTTMNRVTGIYENELSVTFELVAENDQIIYTTVEDDPYDGLSASNTLSTNQEILDQVIGNDGYDIGHVFTTGSGGLAGLGVVCKRNFKARGTTGTDSPVGDPFDVDFVAHEIGHQFDGNHTFNGNQGSCGGNRNPGTAFEPGSGSTIMAYAGICGDDNIQNNSDPYFHAGSIEEILSYIIDDQGSSCAEVTSTGNTPPTVSAPAGGFTIPANTPFRLTATGSDDDGDELTYTWEEIDLGNAGAPGSDPENGPLFRSVTPSDTPTRFFPALGDVLNNNSEPEETLPSVSRELNFRVTARDNNSDGGGTNDDDITFDVTSGAGPFLVTSHTGASTLEGAKAQRVTWDVANTDSSPVNCSDVRILLSTDGGITFDQVLAESTPNDGEAYVLVPNIASARARILIDCPDNIFYNVNRAELQIQETIDPGFTLLVQETPKSTCEDEITYELDLVAINDFGDDVTFSLGATPATIDTQLSEETLTPGESLTITFTSDGDPVITSVDLTASSGTLEEITTLDLRFLSQPQDSPAPESPAQNAVAVDPEVTFDWASLSGALSYRLQLASDDQFDNIVLDQSNLTATTLTLSTSLDFNTTYFWRINAENDCGSGPFTETRKFVTERNASNSVQAQGLPLQIISGATTNSTINIASDFQVSDVNISSLNITHTWIQDLEATITSPGGTTVKLFDQICGDDDNMFVNWDDEGEATPPCPPTDGGSYVPSSPLSAFDGQSSQGNWTLSVSDMFSGDDGTLVGWTLQLGSASDELWLFSSTNDPNSADLEWTNVSGTDSYEIQIASSGDFSTLTTLDGSQTSFTVTGLSSSTSYNFRVRASVNGSLGGFSNEAPVTTFPDIPESPSALEATQINSTSVSLIWNDNSALEDGFIVQRSSESTTAFEEIGRTEAGVVTFLDENALANSTFSYQVSAFNITGTSTPSDFVTIAVLGSSSIPSSLSIFPNPVNTRLFIQGSQDYTTFSISDVSGKQMLQERVLSASGIDVTTLSPGIYFLHLVGPRSAVTLRFHKSN